MSVSIRIDDDLHEWLLDHRDSKRRNISDVIREMRDFWEQCQNDSVVANGKSIQKQQSHDRTTKEF